MERIKDIWGCASWGQPYFIVTGTTGKRYKMDARDIYDILIGKTILKTRKARIHEHITEVKK